MRLLSVTGRSVFKNCSKYRINWDKKERSKFQTEVKNFLYSYLKHHVVYSEFPVFGTRLKIDIFDATTRVAYEVNGRQHSSYVEFFAGSRSGYLNQIKRDVQKEQWCNMNGILFVEISPEDLPLTRNWFIEHYNLYL